MKKLRMEESKIAERILKKLEKQLADLPKREKKLKSQIADIKKIIKILRD